MSEISSLYLASVAAQTGLCLTWSQTPKTGFLVTGLNSINRNRHFQFNPNTDTNYVKFTYKSGGFLKLIIEPRHDKTNKVTVRPARTQISLGIRPV